MDNTPRQVLKELLVTHGPTLMDNPQRCKGFLLDRCQAQRLEVNILTQALEEQVVADLRQQAVSSTPYPVLQARLVKRLQDNRGITEEVARWGVDSWALALGVIQTEPAVSPVEIRSASTPSSTDNTNQSISPTAVVKTKQQWIEEGNQYYKAGSYEDAIRAYSEAIALDKQDGKAYFLRGNAYKDNGQHEQAMNDYQTVLAINPNFADAQVMMAVTAFEFLQKGGGDMLREKGIAEKDLWKVGLAGIAAVLGAFDKALTIDPKNVTAYYQRGLIFAEGGEFKKALDDCNNALILDPRSVDAYIARGRVYMKLEKPKQALNDLNQAIALDPQNVKAYMVRGGIHMQNGSTIQAIDDFGQWITLSPQNPNPYTFRGLVYIQREQYPQAIQDLDQAIALIANQAPNADNSSVYVWRGRIYFELQQYRQALDDAERALALDPQDEVALTLKKEAQRKFSKKGWFS